VILPDVNVLIYAFRPDAARHAEYRAWLDDVVNRRDPYGIAPQVLSSVVRICTHPRFFQRPSTLADTLAFCDVLLKQDHCTQIAPRERHWALFADLCRHTRATGVLVPDAWFAALAIEHGCEWISADADYARFPGLRWRRPFE
jgi:uncharacterized protein